MADPHEVTGTAREMAGKAEKTYGSVKDRATDVAEEVTERADEAMGAGTWENMMGMVQQKPGTAIGISLLAGAGLGALIAYLMQD